MESPPYKKVGKKDGKYIKWIFYFGRNCYQAFPVKKLQNGKIPETTPLQNGYKMVTDPLQFLTKYKHFYNRGSLFILYNLPKIGP